MTRKTFLRCCLAFWAAGNGLPWLFRFLIPRGMKHRAPEQDIIDKLTQNYLRYECVEGTGFFDDIMRRGGTVDGGVFVQEPFTYA